MIRPEIAKRDVTAHILKAFGLRASKRLGQNFLIEPGVVRAIVESAELEPGEHVLEIGPGIGTLTQGLAEAGAQVTAVELDKRLPDVLAETLRGYENVKIIQGDVLKVDLREIMGDEPFKVVANLPYYITTPIILELLEQHLPITRLVTMVQREVAERMTAPPGGKDYGALSVAVQYYTEPEIILDVPPRCFLPAPAVDSVVIACTVRKEPPVTVGDEKLFFRVMRSSFGQRRKTLANALRAAGFPREELEKAMETAGIDGTRRGETLSLAEFAALSRALEK